MACCRLSAPFDLQVAEFYDKDTKRYRVQGKKTSSRFDTLQSTIPSAISSLIYRLSQRAPECFYLLSGAHTSISAQLRPVTGRSVTLKQRMSVFLPQGHTGTNPRHRVGLCDCFHQRHALIQHFSPLYLTLSRHQGHAPPHPLMRSDLKIELL